MRAHKYRTHRGQSLQHKPQTYKTMEIAFIIIMTALWIGPSLRTGVKNNQNE